MLQKQQAEKQIARNVCKAQAEVIERLARIYDGYRDRPDENAGAVLVQLVDFLTRFWYHFFRKSMR